MNRQQRRLSEGALYNDMYQFTMAQLYFRAGLHELPAHFDHFFRNYPNYGEHQAGYCINAGIGWLMDWMQDFRFEDEDIACLRSEIGPDGQPVFGEDFLNWLQREGNFNGLTVQSMGEGRVVHPNTPITSVVGPLAMAQILETPLLNALNFQTLIATKAARVRHSVKSSLLMEFGMRRAHGMGANQGCRAALIGGCDFTSNVGLSYAMGLSPKGTHSHAMVQTYLALGKSEEEAFQAYADMYPTNCLLLVDTIDTLGSGVPNAIKVFEKLRKRGYKPIGIRMDSGDLAYLAIQAARMLDDAGFPDTCITLSNDLDELTIWQIHAQIMEEAARSGVNPENLIRRLTYGVGTRLITSSGQSSLGGVYKLVAIRPDRDWIPAIKLSNSIAKVPNPGHKLAWRIYDKRERATADLVGLADEKLDDPCLILHHPTEKGLCRRIPQSNISRIEPLLKTVWDEGEIKYRPSLEEIRAQRTADLEALDTGVLRLRNPHIYHVSLTSKLLKMKQELIAKFTGESQDQ